MYRNVIPLGYNLKNYILVKQEYILVKQEYILVKQESWVLPSAGIRYGHKQ